MQDATRQRYSPVLLSPISTRPCQAKPLLLPSLALPSPDSARQRRLPTVCRAARTAFHLCMMGCGNLPVCSVPM